MTILAVGRRDPFFLDVLRGLIADGLPIRHLLFLINRKIQRDPAFKDVELLDVREIIKRETILAFPTPDDSLPREFYEKLAEAELYFLSVSDRLSMQPATIRERRYLFWKLANFWHDYLRRSGISRVLFHTLPHSHVNMTLYFVAKALGVDVVYVERTSIPDRIFVLDCFDERNPVPPTFMPDAELEELRAAIPLDLLHVYDVQSAWLKSADGQIAKGLAQFNQSTWRQHLSLTTSTLQRLAQLCWKDTSEKQIRRFALTPAVSESRVLWHEWCVGIHQNGLKKQYQERVAPFEPEVPYVVFYLNFEPERTTIPMGGLFGNILVAIDLLSKALPEGWVCYVKEHPRQFTRGVMGRYYRDRFFYETIASHSNMRFLSPHHSSAELLSNCKATITVSGSVGWEALLAGKPSLIFGHPWYADCPAVFRVDNVETCRQALEAAQAMTEEDVERQLLRYLAYKAGDFHLGINSDHFATLSERGRDELLAGTVKALAGGLRAGEEPGAEGDRSQAGAGKTMVSN